jgi:uncharacterized membrane protein
MMKMDDQSAEQIIGQLLRAGVIVSALVVLFGAFLYLRQAGHATADYHTFHGVARPMTTISGVVRQAERANPLAIMQLGLLLLVATPIARVAFSIFAFALERDWLYVGLTTVVFAVLLFSILQST